MRRIPNLSFPGPQLAILLDELDWAASEHHGFWPPLWHSLLASILALTLPAPYVCAPVQMFKVRRITTRDAPLVLNHTKRMVLTLGPTNFVAGVDGGNFRGNFRGSSAKTSCCTLVW